MIEMAYAYTERDRLLDYLANLNAVLMFVLMVFVLLSTDDPLYWMILLICLAFIPLCHRLYVVRAGLRPLVRRLIRTYGRPKND